MPWLPTLRVVNWRRKFELSNHGACTSLGAYCRMVSVDLIVEGLGFEAFIFFLGFLGLDISVMANVQKLAE